MPLATNPNARFDLVLDSDQATEAGKRPTFEFHYISGLEVEELAGTLSSLNTAATGDEAMTRIYSAIEKHLVGWRNMTDRAGKAIKFGRGALKKVVGMDEIFELAFKLMNRQAVSAADKKKLDSPSGSSTDKSAGNVPALKNAPTSRTKPKQ
jgi:hypothetical protein